MHRRALLKALAAWPAAHALVHAQQATVPLTSEDAVAQGRAGFFNASQFAALRRLSGMIYPPFRSHPGALECSVPEFLDFLLSQSPADRQALYRDGLDHLNAQGAFAELSEEKASALLAPLHEPWTYRAPSDSFAHFLREVKEDVQTATENSHPWLTAESRRTGHAEGMGTYWRNPN